MDWGGPRSAKAIILVSEQLFDYGPRIERKSWDKKTSPRQMHLVRPVKESQTLTDMGAGGGLGDVKTGVEQVAR